MDKADAEKAADLIQEIGGIVISDESYAGTSWQSLAIVVTLDETMRRKSGFYWDDAGKAHPDYPRSGEFLDKLEELQSVTRGPTGRSWTCALIRLKRDSMAMTIDYEYDDPGRWKVTPLNIEQMREELRPK